MALQSTTKTTLTNLLNLIASDHAACEGLVSAVRRTTSGATATSILSIIPFGKPTDPHGVADATADAAIATILADLAAN